MPIAKLFTHGGGQAVRLPAGFRFPGTEVRVRRVGNEVVLSAVAPLSADALIDALRAFEPGTALHREQPGRKQRRATIRAVR